jgi:endonuclease/exonuclease/phosphatase (EEP) superfamily protein YafD
LFILLGCLLLVVLALMPVVCVAWLLLFALLGCTGLLLVVLVACYLRCLVVLLGAAWLLVLVRLLGFWLLGCSLLGLAAMEADSDTKISNFFSRGG